MSKNGRLEVITTDESGRWDEILQQVGAYAFYHRAAYHRLAENRGEGEARLLVYLEDGHLVAFPILVRPVGSTDIKDATSVRGFAGPAASHPSMPDDVLRRFRAELQDYLKQSGIISIYARLNPLTCPTSLLDGLGATVEVGATVSLDLSVPSDVQFSRYRHGYRREIKRLRRLGFTFEEASPESLGEFMRVYYDAMTRVNADPEFYFGQDYFEFLFREMPDVMHLFLCKLDGIVASASIQAVCSGIVESYMGGTSTSYVRFSPDKLKYDTVREWGKSIGAHTYHLGGGVGAQRGSLYDFKMGFGGREHIYSTWRHVVDQKAYDDICSQVDHSSLITHHSSYFPAYRDPALRQEVRHAA